MTDTVRNPFVLRRFSNITPAIAKAAPAYVSKWEAASEARGPVAGGASP